MNYGLFYKQVDFNRHSTAVVKNAIANENLKWNPGKLQNHQTEIKRYTDVAWLRDKTLLSMFLRMGKQINRSAHWNLHLTGVEPIQFGSYGEGGFYDWHQDQHPSIVNGVVRKISMTLFLNNEYEGGEFDLEIYKPGEKQRFVTIKPKPYSAVFFLADQWHRVRPVTAGHRKSLVAWFYGPPYV
tara:strand:- start:556 stop:1107 length:552 start_codon:yes stop_codon:yes gene_type:complete